MNISWPDGTIETLSDEVYILIDPTGSFYDPEELMGSKVRLITNIKRGFLDPGESVTPDHKTVCRTDRQYAEHIVVPKKILKPYHELPDDYREAMYAWIDTHVNKAFRDGAKADLQMQYILYYQKDPPYLTAVTKHGTCLFLNLDHDLTKIVFIRDRQISSVVEYKLTLWDGVKLRSATLEQIHKKGGLSWLKSLSKKE